MASTIKIQSGFVVVKNGRVSCTCSNLELNTSGGDEGYNETFILPIRQVAYDFFVTFTAFFVPDQLILTANNEQIYDSGCIGTGTGQPSSVSATVRMPAFAASLNINVIPNCAEPAGGTAWVLFLSGVCLKESL